MLQRIGRLVTLMQMARCMQIHILCELAVHFIRNTGTPSHPGSYLISIKAFRYRKPFPEASAVSFNVIDIQKTFHYFQSVPSLHCYLLKKSIIRYNILSNIDLLVVLMMEQQSIRSNNLFDRYNKLTNQNQEVNV